MVAPHSANDIVQSFVRVPGTGSGINNQSAPAVCCDLSRGSSLASIVTVPDTLPSVCVPGTGSATSCESAPAVSISDILPTTKPTPSVINLKRPRPEDDQENCSNDDKDDNGRIDKRKILKTVGTQTLNSSDNELVGLRQENSLLREENQTLQKQLQLFKQLVINPELLSAVLQRVQEKTEQN